jgi:hypothetical protein
MDQSGELGEKTSIATTQVIAAAFTDWSAQAKIAPIIFPLVVAIGRRHP